MFQMTQHTYFATPSAPAPKQYSNHSTSSAFSSSANPDEDWTKISDLAERRRIQNRIAQRNYRKKLKMRLEDLERRAGKSDRPSAAKGGQSASKAASSSSGSKRPQPAQAQPQERHQQQLNKAQKPQMQAPPRRAAPPSQFTPPMHDDDVYMFPDTYDDRDRSHTPPMFTYSSYPPPPEDMLMHGYTQSYRPMNEFHPDYLASPSVPVTLPSMTHFSDAIKREPPAFTGSEEPLYISYHSYIPGLDMGGPAPSAYDHPNPHTPPLSHGFNHSASCSDSGSYDNNAYPTTPLSMPDSPCQGQGAM